MTPGRSSVYLVPLVQVVAPGGTFTLPDLPPGRYEIVVWHAQLRAATQTVTVASGQSVPLTFAMQ